MNRFNNWSLWLLASFAVLNGCSSTSPSMYDGTWTLLSNKEFQPRRGFACCECNGKIYVIGGMSRDTAVTNDYEIQTYDPLSDTWLRVLDSGGFIPRTYHTASCVNGLIYVIGGGGGDVLPGQRFGVAPMQVFDPSISKWSSPSTSGFFYPRTDHAAAVVDGQISIIGGIDGNEISKGIDIFDPATNTWHTWNTGQRTNYIYPSECSASAVGDSIYIMGGVISGGSDDSNEWFAIFNPITGDAPWPAHDNFEARVDCASAAWNGRVYVFGGYAGLQYYDTKTRQWVTPMTLPSPLSYHMGGIRACSVGGKIYFLDGTNIVSYLPNP